MHEKLISDQKHLIMSNFPNIQAYTKTIPYNSMFGVSKKETKIFVS